MDTLGVGMLEGMDDTDAALECVAVVVLEADAEAVPVAELEPVDVGADVVLEVTEGVPGPDTLGVGDA